MKITLKFPQKLEVVRGGKLVSIPPTALQEGDKILPHGSLPSWCQVIGCDESGWHTCPCNEPHWDGKDYGNSMLNLGLNALANLARRLEE